MKAVYFDNAATTKMRDEVIDAITQTMKNSYGNPSSSYMLGRTSKSLVETARKTIANLLNVSAGEIIFTSGGTEADNFLLKSAIRDLEIKHIITTKIEHHAVLHTVQELEREYGIAVTYLALDEFGSINFKMLETLLKNNTRVLVSLMHVNNEIGNILDIKRVADLCKANNALFHTDAVQSIGHYNLDLNDIKVDFLAASAHKFHGPKGIGFAFVRKNSGLKPFIYGGEQERGLRAGTECVHNIVGLEKAMVLASKNLEQETDYIKDLKTYFIQQLKLFLPSVKFNGLSEDEKMSTYTLVNVRLPIDLNKSELFLFQLDLKGIACSRGSACQSGSNQKSHVLSEILNEYEINEPSIRFSFSKFNTKDEIDYLIIILKNLLK